MDELELVLKSVMIISTGVLFAYGLFKGYDTLELFIYDFYFLALILYLFKTNFLESE